MALLQIILALTTALLAATYLGIILLASRGLNRLRKERPAAAGVSATISIIVPFRDERANLGEIFEDLINQDYPREKYEIIFVDDHSTDGGYERLSGLIREKAQSISIRLFSLAGEGYSTGSKKSAITCGIGKSSGELIVTTDADCRQGKYWLKTLSGFYAERKPAMLIGPVCYSGKGNWLTGFYKLDFAALVATGAGLAAIGRPIFCSGANLAYEKSLFAEVNGFEGHERYSSGDDVFLLQKVVKNRGPECIRVVFHREAMVTTPAPSNLKGFLRQRIRWGGKSKAYPSTFARVTAATVFLLHFFLLLLLASGFVNHWALIFTGLLLLLKSLADFRLLKRFNQLLDDKLSFGRLLTYELIYIPYIIIAGIGAIFLSTEWKGRKDRF